MTAQFCALSRETVSWGPSIIHVDDGTECECVAPIRITSFAQAKRLLEARLGTPTREEEREIAAMNRTLRQQEREAES